MGFKEFLQAWRRGWRAGRIERLRERLVVLKIRREVLLNIIRVHFPADLIYHERYCRTVEEIGLTRFRLGAMGVEVPSE